MSDLDFNLFNVFVPHVSVFGSLYIRLHAYLSIKIKIVFR